MALSNGRLKLIAYPRTEEQERRYELYDTWEDPSELEDRFAESESTVESYRSELEGLRTRAVAWQQETTRRRMGAPANPSSVNRRGDSPRADRICLAWDSHTVIHIS